MDYLMHHGIKGQKWGVVKGEENKGSNPNLGEKKLSEISPNQNPNTNDQSQNKPNVPQNTQKPNQKLGIDFKREAIQAAQRAVIRAGATLLTALLVQEGTKVMKIGAYAAEKAAYKNLAKNSPAAAMKLKDLAIGAEVLKPRK